MTLGNNSYLCLCTSVRWVTPVGAENAQCLAAGFPTSTPEWHSWSVLQDPLVWLTVLRPALGVTHCGCSHSQPCAASAEPLLPQSLRATVAQGVWPEEVHSGSSRAAAPVTAASVCYSWASQFGWVQWIIVVSWAIKLKWTVMHLIWDSQITSF